jgi:hypothetical protein
MFALSVGTWQGNRRSGGTVAEVMQQQLWCAVSCEVREASEPREKDGDRPGLMQIDRQIVCFRAAVISYGYGPRSMVQIEC